MTEDVFAMPEGAVEGPKEVVFKEEIEAAINKTNRSTRERLVEALKEEKMPVWIVQNAELGIYEFDGRAKLLKALTTRGPAGVRIIKRMSDGEFNHDVHDMMKLFEKARREGRPVGQQQKKPPTKKQRLEAKRAQKFVNKDEYAQIFKKMVESVGQSK